MHQLNKGVEIAIILGNNAGKTFAAVARTLNVRKHALFKRCKQAWSAQFHRADRLLSEELRLHGSA